jgi:cytoskeletal protein CcmA (bactofilin family)
MSKNVEDYGMLPRGLTITGELSASQDTMIQGRFHGRISLPDHHLSIDASASVNARIVARSVTISGALEGSVSATDRVRILQGASVSAHVMTPTLLLADGARFNGSVDPERTESAMHVAKYREKNG